MLKFDTLVAFSLLLSYAPIVDNITAYGTRCYRYVTEIQCALVCVLVKYLADDVHIISFLHAPRPP